MEYTVIMEKLIYWDKPDVGVCLNTSWKKIKEEGIFGYIQPEERNVILQKTFTLPFIPFKGLQLCKVDNFPEEVDDIRWKRNAFIVKARRNYCARDIEDLEKEVRKYIDDGWSVIKDYDPWKED